MDENRKQIIIHEIDFWKKNRLLPEHYCDFLLALYTEGSGIAQKSGTFHGRKRLLLWLLLIPVIMFFIYFTELSLILQITFSTVFLLAGIFITVYYAKSRLSFQVPLIISSILFLFVTVEWAQKIFSDSVVSLYSILMIHCLIWLGFGKKWRLIYFTLSGILGILLLAISLCLSIFGHQSLFLFL